MLRRRALLFVSGYILGCGAHHDDLGAVHHSCAHGECDVDVLANVVDTVATVDAQHASSESGPDRQLFQWEKKNYDFDINDYDLNAIFNAVDTLSYPKTNFTKFNESTEPSNGRRLSEAEPRKMLGLDTETYQQFIDAFKQMMYEKKKKTTTSSAAPGGRRMAEAEPREMFGYDTDSLQQFIDAFNQMMYAKKKKTTTSSAAPGGRRLQSSDLMDAFIREVQSAMAAMPAGGIRGGVPLPGGVPIPSVPSGVIPSLGRRLSSLDLDGFANEMKAALAGTPVSGVFSVSQWKDFNNAMGSFSSSKSKTKTTSAAPGRRLDGNVMNIGMTALREALPTLTADQAQLFMEELASLMGKSKTKTTSGAPGRRLDGNVMNVGMTALKEALPTFTASQAQLFMEELASLMGKSKTKTTSAAPGRRLDGNVMNVGMTALKEALPTFTASQAQLFMEELATLMGKSKTKTTSAAPGRRLDGNVMNVGMTALKEALPTFTASQGQLFIEELANLMGKSKTKTTSAAPGRRLDGNVMNVGMTALKEALPTFTAAQAQLFMEELASLMGKTKTTTTSTS